MVTLSVVSRLAAWRAFAVVTFVPPQADIGRLLKGQTVFGIRNPLIDMTHANELRIRNAWVRGSNPLCGTNLAHPDTSLKQARERRDRAPAASDANAVPIKCMIGRFVTFRATHDVAFKLQWPL